MRKTLILLTSFVFLSLFYACKDTATATKEASKEAPIVVAKESAQENANSLRAQALSILNHRIKEDPEIYAAVEAGVWEYEFVFNGKEMSKPGEKAGNWTNFKNDHTYDYGKYDILQGKGKYHFKLDEMKLLMIDDNPAYPPQEWDIKLAGNAMVMIGNQLYGNAAYQIKLLNDPDFPKKAN